MHNLLLYKIDNLKREFNSDLKLGLTTNQVKKNLEKYGFNTIGIEKFSILKIFLSQFNIFIILLLFSATFSIIMGEILDALFIGIFIVLDLTLGFFQEYKSAKTASLLQKYNNFNALVTREGNEAVIEHHLLVPGDIVELKSGDIVPADIKIFESNELFVNESSLSGESTPVFKSRSQSKVSDQILYSGTFISKGYAKGIVVYTGKLSRIGHISKLTTVSSSKSTYEIEAQKLSNFIFKLVAITLLIAFVLNYYLNFQDSTKFILYSIALAVTVIPEALPLVITFSLSNGALRLIKKKVLVKRLTAIEDLGGVEVLCSDKTGTLTENKLKIADTISVNGFDLGKLAYMSVSQIGEIDSFDKAILDHYKLSFKYEVLNELPFDPLRRKSSKIVKYNSSEHLIVKGAFESLNANILNNASSLEKLQKFINIESKKGRRVLVFGHLEVKNKKLAESIEDKITLSGAISFEDPIRFSAFEALKKAENLNIDIRILTGDSKEVAYYVGQKFGLVKSMDEVFSFGELATLSPQDYQDKVLRSKIFCRVSPEEKYNIIKTLQSKYQVGYLGDGINDAPSLKVSNVGIAVSNSTDIAKSASDIILTQKSLEVIIDGIIEGRKIFYNISKYIKITIASNFGNYIAMLSSVFFVPFLPLKPLQILLLNLVSDIPLMSVSSDNVDKVELKKPSISNFDYLLKVILIIGLISTFFDFLTFFYFREFGEGVLQTSWFLASVLTEIIIIFSLRTPRFFLKGPKPSIILALVSVVTIVLSFISIYYQPIAQFFGFVWLDLSHILVIFGLVLTYFIISEAVKLFIKEKLNEKYT